MTNEIMNRHHSLLDGFVRILAFKNELCYMCLFFLFLTLPYAASQNTGNSTQWQSNDDPYDYSSDFFSPSMGIALVVIIVALFIFGCCSVFCRSCNGENIGLPGISLRGISIHGREGMSRRGLDPATIETFPTFSYSYVKGHHLGKGALECAVCLNEFEDQDTLRLLPKCDHVFHPECIDAWLCNRTTCPVCRANVASATGFSVHDMEDDSDEEIATSGAGDVENQQVTSEAPEAVAVGAAAAEPRTKPARAKFMGRFPRSNSTGHSLVQPGEDIERFTLRLPDEVRKQVMNMRQLNRTWSMVSLPRVGSSRKGYRTTGEGSSRGGRSMWEKPENWVLSMTPSFLMRAPSPRPSKMTEEERTPATPRVKPFKSPLRMFSKANGTESASTRPLV